MASATGALTGQQHFIDTGGWRFAAFDPEGKPVSGPPKAAGQELSRYPLKIEGGLLYIAMSVRSVGTSGKHASHASHRPKGSASDCSVAPEDLA